MDATLLVRERIRLNDTAFVEMVLWRLPGRLRGSAHAFKYRLALIANNVCVLRYDNEAGKGDHVHIGAHVRMYQFVDLTTLDRDFWKDVSEWMETQ